MEIPAKQVPDPAPPLVAPHVADTALRPIWHRLRALLLFVGIPVILIVAVHPSWWTHPHKSAAQGPIPNEPAPQTPTPSEPPSPKQGGPDTVQKAPGGLEDPPSDAREPVDPGVPELQKRQRQAEPGPEPSAEPKTPTPYEPAPRSLPKMPPQMPSQAPVAFDMLLQEKAAVRAIVAIHIGQQYYYSQHGEYARSLAALGHPEERQGYRFTLMATPDGYTINADPLVFGTSGSRTFYSDQTRTIHSNAGQEPATATSPMSK